MAHKTYILKVDENFEPFLEELREYFHLSSHAEVIRTALGLLKLAKDHGELTIRTEGYRESEGGDE